MTAEEWDTRWHQIRVDAQDLGVGWSSSCETADRETVEQFGPRPTETP